MKKQSDQSQSKPQKSKKTYILIGAVFIVCALVLKRDTH